VDLDTVADELYGLPPDAFTPTRDARATEARSAGDRDLAAAIKKLRRPTTGAWLANLLARERNDQLAELLDLGAAMRQAQADLAGDDLRRLSQQRRQVVAALGDEARRLARYRGQPASQASIGELEATLEAALADAGAAEALRRGRLTTALRYSGFGPVDLTEASVAPAEEKAPQPSAGGRTSAGRRESTAGERSGTERRRERVKKAEQELRAAEAAAADAEREADEQERRLSDARAEEDRRHRQVSELEKRLRDLRGAREQAGRDLLRAEKAQDAAARRLRTAHDRAARARAVIDRLAPPDS
jgi:DNA repair exonuclease SbcCD ATPase subunit